MTNSGVPSFPQPGQYRAEGQQRSQESNLRVGRLDKAPNEIRAEIIAERRATKLEGEITQVRQDERINVRTSQGDVEVKLPADERHQQRPPQVGQRVEVEIQPPSQDAPEQPPQVIVRPTPSQSTQPVEVQEQPQPIPERSSSTPVQVEVRESDTSTQTRPTQEATIPRPDPSAPPPQNTFPETGSIVRLDPIAPEQFEQLIATRQIIVSNAVQQTLTQTLLPVLDILPQNASIVIQASALTVPAAQVTAQVFTPASEVSTLLNPPPQTVAQGIQVQQVQLPAILTTDLNSAFNAAVRPSENQISVPVLTRAQAAIQHIQSLAGDLLPNTSSPITPSVTAEISQDVRIGNIQQPQVSLIAPAQSDGLLIPSSSAPVNASAEFIVNSQKASQITGTVIAKTEGNIPIVQFSPPQNVSAPITPQSQNSSVTLPAITAEQPQAVTSFLQSEPLLFALQFPSELLLAGSQIDVTPQSLVSSQAQVSQSVQSLAQSLPVLPYANVAFPEPWPAMQAVQQAILQSTAQAAAQSAQAFSASIPSPANPAQFAPAALFFMAAVRGGDLSSWLGERTTELLKSSGKGSLLSRLTGEAGIGGRPADAPSSDWRGMHIPLLWEGDIQKVVLHYKHDSASEEHDQQGGQKGTRFLFDLNLEGMGKVQLDGFFRPVSTDGPRLDIILRTKERFSSVMQGEMRRLYMDAIKPSGVGGELSFQDGFEHWVMIDAQNDGFFGLSA